MTRLAVLALLAGLTAMRPALAQAPAPAAAAPTVVPRYLVVPFENTSRDPRGYWLSEGSAVILSDDLRAMSLAPITRDDRLRAFERLNIPSSPTLSHATVIRLGQVVGAAHVVLGRFQLSGDDVIVRARTIRLDTGRMSTEVTEAGPLRDLFAVYGRVARRLVSDSGVSFEEMEQVHPPLAGFEQFIKGVLAEAPPTRLAYLTQALQLAPEFQRARLALWAVHTDVGDHRQALAAVRPVPLENRLGRQARFLAAFSMIQLAQYQEAFDTLSELQRVSADSAILNNLGVVQLRRPAGAPGGRAVSFFNEAATLDRNDSDLFFNLGYAYFLDRDPTAAAYWLREAVRRNPADAQAHYVLGMALQGTGGTAEANRERELARRLSSEFADWEAKTPNNPVPRGLERLKEDVDIPAALRMENVIVAAGQRDQQELASIHLASGRRLLEAERDVEAIAELRRAVYLAPYQAEAHLLLGRAYLRGQRIDEAVDALKISIWSSDTLEARLSLADAHLAARNTTEARAELQAVLARDPENARARALIAQLP